MKVYFALVVLAFVALASAYDFSDVSFNNLILEDYQEHLDNDYSVAAVHSLRSRRDAGEDDKCKRRKNCCGETWEFKPTPKDKEIKKECLMEIMAKDGPPKAANPMSCEAMKQFKNKFMCVGECFAKKKGIIDDAGAANDDAMKKLTLEVFVQDDWQKPIVEAAFDKCLPMAKKAAAEMPKEEGMCNPLPMKMVHCLWREIQLTCPEDKMVKTPKCMKLREMVKSNEFFMPMFEH